MIPSTTFRHLLALSLFFLFALTTSNLGKACNNSDVALDSIIQVGTEYDIYVTLCIGAGRQGAVQGADGPTNEFAFAFYTCNAGPINISSWTPTITGDTTGVTATGFNTGPQPSPPFGAQGTVLYDPQGQDLTCISNPNQCGLPHIQCFQFVFRVDVIPDSIRVFGVEGAGSPTSGCYPDADMLVDLSSQSPCGSNPPTVTCPGPQTIFDCVLPDYVPLTTAVDSTDPNPVILQNPIPGIPITTPTIQVTMTATDFDGESDSCTFTVTVVDTVPPVAVCGTDTTFLDGFGNAFFNPGQLDGGSSDNCSPSVGRSASPSFAVCGDLTLPHQVRLYARCPREGAPVGHAFIQLLPQTGPDAGRTDLYYGFNSFFQTRGSDGIGTIASEMPQPTDLSYSYTLSTDEYNAVVAAVRASIASPPRHNLIQFNSVDWAESVLSPVISFPNADFDSINAPGVLKTSLESLPGAVAWGSTFPTGTSFPVDTSGTSHYDYKAIVEGAPLDPAGFASYLGTPLLQNQLAGVSLNQQDSFSVTLLNIDLNLNTVAVNWGDGTIEHRQTNFQHSYAASGLYTVNIISLDTIALHHYYFDLFADITLPTSAPKFINTVPGPVSNAPNPDLVAPFLPDSATALPAAAPLLTVTDGQGNTDTCRATVYVLDTLPPVAACNNITIQLDTSGSDTIFADQILASASDNCGVEYVGGNPIVLTCESLGTIPYRLSAVDSSGNAGTCVGSITIVDTLPPNANCNPFTIYLDASASDTLLATDIAGSIADNCGVINFGVPSPNSFDCGDIGVNTVTLAFSDVNGNSTTCTVAVTVEDTLPPVLTPCPSNQSLNPLPTACGAPASWAPPTATDNCAGVVVSSNKNPNDFFSPGSTTVLYTATDPGGNTDTCSFVITILAPALATSTTPVTLSNGTNILCNGTNTGSATTSAIGGCPPYTYLWSNGATTASATGLSPAWNTVSVTDQNGDVYVDSIFLVQPGPLAANIPSLPAVCEGGNTGTFLLSLSGGDTTGREFCVLLNGGPAQVCYPENNSIVSAGPLPSGVHIALLTDSSGCQWTDTITIDSVPNPMVDLGPDTTICPGTSATLDAGNPGAMYQWTTGQNIQVINPTQPQTIAVLVTDGNGCQGRDTVTVAVFPGPNTGISSNGPICESENLVLSGPSGNPSYLWTGPNGFVSTLPNNTVPPPHQPGPNVYQFTTSGPDGCVEEDSLVITVFADPVVALATDTVLCDGAVVSLDAGNPGSFYAWSNSATTQTITINSGGTYSVTVTTLDGCTDTGSINVSTEVSPVATFNALNGPGPLAFDFDDLSTGNPTSWLWDFGDGNSSTQQNPSHTYGSTATFTVCLTVTGPCGTDQDCQSLVVTSNGPSGIQGPPVTVFPNPSDGHAWLQYNRAEPIQVEVFDAHGKSVLNRSHDAPLAGERVEMDLSGLAAGIYYLRYATPTTNGSIRLQIVP